MNQPRANIGQFVPAIGDCSPFGDITFTAAAGEGITYVEGPRGFGCHLSEAAQRDPDIVVQFSPDEAPGFKAYAPQWRGIVFAPQARHRIQKALATAAAINRAEAAYA